MYKIKGFKNLPIVSTDFITRYAVYKVKKAIKISKANPRANPACPTAHGMLNRDVPIMVFHMLNLKTKW